VIVKMGKPPPMLIEKETIEYLHRIELLLDGEEAIGKPVFPFIPTVVFFSFLAVPCNLEKEKTNIPANLEKELTNIPANTTRTSESGLTTTKLPQLEDPQIFVDNVLSEVKANPTSVIMDPEGSRVIEKVLRVATHENIFTFFKMVFSRLEELCFHRNGSHVIQTLLCLSTDIMDEEISYGTVVTEDYEPKKEREEGEAPAQSLQELLFDMCELMMDGWVNLAFDQYGSHIFRVILNILTGRKPETLARSKVSIHYNSEKNNTFSYGKKKKPNKQTAEVTFFFLF